MHKTAYHRKPTYSRAKSQRQTFLCTTLKSFERQKTTTKKGSQYLCKVPWGTYRYRKIPRGQRGVFVVGRSPENSLHNTANIITHICTWLVTWLIWLKIILDDTQYLSELALNWLLRWQSARASGITYWYLLIPISL